MENQAQEGVTPTPSIKEIVRQEYKNCVQDVPHFIKKYTQIEHPQKGRIPFALFPFQDKVVNIFANPKDHRYIVVNKCRQLGISTLVAAYALWLMLFHENKNILVIATKQETAKNMITKVRFMYKNLPKWLQLPTLEDNKLSIKLSNGSQIKAVSAAGDSGRSEAVSLLIIDEAAFIEDIDEIFPAAQQTLSTGGACIVISTPKGVGGWFYDTFTQGELGKNGFTAVKLPWYLHPEKDQKWRDEQDKILGKKAAAQENDCNFNTSGDTVIDPDVLAVYKEKYLQPPVEKRGFSHDYWIWKYPDYSKSYMLIADTARGDDKDYSAFQVIDITAFEQVAEFECKLPTRDYAKLVLSVATEYNNALVVVENQSIGWDVVQSVVESGYANVYYSPKNVAEVTADSYISKYDGGNTVAGFTNSTRTRPLVVSRLKEAIHDYSFIIHSARLISQLETFIWEGGKPQAMKGSNDDLCLAAGIGCYVRDTSLRFDAYNVDMARASVGAMTKTHYNAADNPGPYRGVNPYKMQIGNQNHDISWLL